MTNARTVAAATLAAAALVLPACGGDDGGAGGQGTGGSAPSSPADAGGAGSTPRVAIQTADEGFDPAAIYESVSPGVVTINATIPGLGGGILGGRGGIATGSGFVISDRGEIVTNAHVVTDAEAGGGGAIDEASVVYVQFADRNRVRAEIVGFDPFADVALLKVDPDGLDLHPVELGQDRDLRVGEPVAAIGSPFSQDQSLSTGIISAVDRSIDSLTDFKIEGGIQTDAAINPGNSGGPLLDAEGRVIGIDQQINTSSGGSEGVGFAVPIDLAKRSVAQLREDGSVEYAYIGVTTTPLYPQLAERLGLDTDSGALVTRVVPGGPADDAGLRGRSDSIRFQGISVGTGGDVITAVDGHRIEGADDLPKVISLLDPGEEVTLEVIRDGERQQIDVTLGKRPESIG
jgi:S1-C subfamily serine protease